MCIHVVTVENVRQVSRLSSVTMNGGPLRLPQWSWVLARAKERHNLPVSEFGFDTFLAISFIRIVSSFFRTQHHNKLSTLPVRLQETLQDATTESMDLYRITGKRCDHC